MKMRVKPKSQIHSTNNPNDIRFVNDNSRYLINSCSMEYYCGKVIDVRPDKNREDGIQNVFYGSGWYWNG